MFKSADVLILRCAVDVCSQLSAGANGERQWWNSCCKKNGMPVGQKPWQPGQNKCRCWDIHLPSATHVLVGGFKPYEKCYSTNQPTVPNMGEKCLKPPISVWRDSFPITTRQFLLHPSCGARLHRASQRHFLSPGGSIDTHMNPRQTDLHLAPQKSKWINWYHNWLVWVNRARFI